MDGRITKMMHALTLNRVEIWWGFVQ